MWYIKTQKKHLTQATDAYLLTECATSSNNNVQN